MDGDLVESYILHEVRSIHIINAYYSILLSIFGPAGFKKVISLHKIISKSILLSYTFVAFRILCELLIDLYIKYDTHKKPNLLIFKSNFWLEDIFNPNLGTHCKFMMVRFP